MKVLNLGCGTNPFKSTDTIDYTNIDIVELEGVDLVYDLNEIPYPFESGSIDEIVMNDILEHLNDPIDVMRECYRLLKEGGLLKIKVVFWNHFLTYSDPQHKHAFTPRYFEVFTGKFKAWYFDFHFKDLKIEYIFDEKAKQRFGEDTKVLLEKAYFYCNVIQGLKMELIK